MLTVESILPPICNLFNHFLLFGTVSPGKNPRRTWELITAEKLRHKVERHLGRASGWAVAVTILYPAD